MKVLVIGDTHKDKMNALPHVMKNALERGVSLVLHCGDIEKRHVSKDIFCGLPVICALVKDQNSDKFFEENCPEKWTFTRTGKRFVTLSDDTKVYVGHERHMDAYRKTDVEFNALLADLRSECDGLRYVFGGHLHVQAYLQGPLVSFINPGAIENAVNKAYEYAILDTDNHEVVFTRILPTPDNRETWSLGVISETFDVSHSDPSYWGKQAEEFRRRDVTHIIICGNLDLEDVGRKEFESFVVHYAIRSDQVNTHAKLHKQGKIPENWKVIAVDKPDDGAIVKINGYHLFVQLNLGLRFRGKSERDLDAMATEIRGIYPETDIVLCGFTHRAMYFEGEQVTTINPGDAVTDHDFVVICFPRKEITFGHVAYDPLPPLGDGKG